MSDQYKVHPKSPPIKLVIYSLLLKQYELVEGAVNALINHQYVVGMTLTRSLTETYWMVKKLHQNPAQVQDFIEFSEAVCNTDLDHNHKQVGLSKTRVKNLARMFSINKIMEDDKEADLPKIDTKAYYQNLCNAVHPSIEPVSVFYNQNNPPQPSFSNIGIRRLLAQLAVEVNLTNDILLAYFSTDETLKRRVIARHKLFYPTIMQTDAWHRANPSAKPPYDKNQELRVSWSNGEASIVLSNISKGHVLREFE